VGGGYTYLAIVADAHPMTHPPKTKRSLCRVLFVPADAAITKMTVHTTAHPMLYAA
jgi:hypothetical protein